MMSDRRLGYRQIGMDRFWRRVTRQRVYGRAGGVAAMCAITDQGRRLGGRRCGRSIVVGLEGR